MESSKKNKINSIRLIKQLELATKTTTTTTTTTTQNGIVATGEQGLKYYELLKLLATVKYTRNLLLDCDDFSSSSHASTSHSVPIGSIQDLQHRLDVAESILHQKMAESSKPSLSSSTSSNYDFDFLSPSIPSLPSLSTPPSPSTLPQVQQLTTPSATPSSSPLPPTTARHYPPDSVSAVLGTVQESEGPPPNNIQRRDSKEDVFGEEILVKSVSPILPSVSLPPPPPPISSPPLTTIGRSGRRLSLVVGDGATNRVATPIISTSSISSNKNSGTPLLPPPRASTASKLPVVSAGDGNTLETPSVVTGRNIRSRRSNLLAPPSSSSSSSAIRGEADSPSGTTPLMEHHLSLQSSLLTNLNEMSTQLKTNSLNFSKGLEKDKLIMLDAQEKLEGNLGVMKKEGGRLGSYGGKQKGTTWIVLGVVAAVGAMWIGTFLLIKVT